MKKIVRSGHPVTSSVVSGSTPPAGTFGKNKPGLVSGSKTNRSSVVRSVRPKSSNKRGGPAGKPSGRGVSSGGGSFGQK